MDVIRVRDGLVMSWPMVEKMVGANDVFVPYCGDQSAGTIDRATARDTEERLATLSKASILIERTYAASRAAEANGKLGVASLLWAVAEAHERSVDDSARMQFLQRGAELIYRNPNDYVPEGAKNQDLRDMIWEKPWICRVVGGTCGAGANAREAIDDAIRQTIKLRKS